MRMLWARLIRGCNILLAKVLLRFTTGAARHMLSTEADNLDGRKLYLLLLSRYAPSWRPDTKAELIRKMVNFVFATDTMANLDKSFTALRELEKSLCEMDPHRTEVDYIEAIHVALSNTVFFEKLYTVLDFGRSHHNLHPGDYLVEMRKFLKVVLSAKAKARTAPAYWAGYCASLRWWRWWQYTVRDFTKRNRASSAHSVSSQSVVLYNPAILGIRVLMT